MTTPAAGFPLEGPINYVFVLSTRGQTIESPSRGPPGPQIRPRQSLTAFYSNRPPPPLCPGAHEYKLRVFSGFLSLTRGIIYMHPITLHVEHSLPAARARKKEALCCGQFVFQDHVAPVLQAAQKHVYGNV